MSVIDHDVYDYGELDAEEGNGEIVIRGLLFCSSPDDSMAEVQVGMAQYQYPQPHPTAAGYYVKKFQAIQRKFTSRWDFTVTYTNQIVKNPLNEPATIGEIKSVTIPGATILDANNSVICNTAGEPVEPFDMPETLIAYPISKNIAGLGDWLLNFERCINSDTVRLGSFVCDPLTLLINSIQISAENTQGNITYRTATIEVWRRKSKWLEIFPSRGFNEKVKTSDLASQNALPAGSKTSNSTFLSPIIVNGQKPDTAQFLDKNGKWVQNPTPSKVVILTAQLYPAIQFSAFPLQ